MPRGLTNCCFRALRLYCLRASPPGDFKAFILLEMHCKCSIKRDRSSHSSCKFQPSSSASQSVKRLSWSTAASAKDPYLLLISTKPSASNSWNARNQTSQECLPSPPSHPLQFEQGILEPKPNCVALTAYSSFHHQPCKTPRAIRCCTIPSAQRCQTRKAEGKATRMPTTEQRGEF